VRAGIARELINTKRYWRWRSPSSSASEGSTMRKSELEAAKERTRAYQARRYADPEYRTRKQRYYAEKRADPEWYAAHKKKLRKYYRTTGRFLPNRKRSQQRAYAKLVASPEWRERHNAKQRERYHNDPVFRAR
jgi:hypothetical protein